jgi:hypothetical protein
MEAEISWIVSRLLMETPQIKESHDFDSDDYNNLLVIEKKIAGMIENNMFSVQEKRILSLITEGYLFGDIESQIGLGRDTVSKIYKNICERIAFSLGGEFTNDGFIREVSRRHHLSPKEQEKLILFMASNLKHKILRRPTHNNE